jgi:hypothetical protein
MDRLFQDVRIAFRSLARQRTFSLVAVLTLALGVGATTAIFSVVHGVLLKPLPYEAADRLVAFGQTAKSAPAEPVDGSSSHLNFQDWKRQSKTIAEMALYSGGSAVVSNQGEADVVRMGSVTPDFFRVFRAAPSMGRAFTADESRAAGPRAVVVSYGFWQERFGGRADVLTQSVEISGVPWPVVGVAPRGFDFPNGARLWLPVRNDDQQCGRGCVYLNGIGRLAEGATVAAAHPPFDVDMNEMAEYAMDKVGRRLGAIESARGANLLDIDVDASPEVLEEKFHTEDQAELAMAG